MTVQPHLAPCDASRVSDQPEQGLQIVRSPRLRWMHACCEPHIGVRSRQRLPGLRVGHINGDGHHAVQTSLPGPLQNGIDAIRVSVAGQVAVGIKHAASVRGTRGSPVAFPAVRIICLTPSATEILCAIGGESMLVGRSHDAEAPASIASVPILTSGPALPSTPDAVDAAVTRAMATSGSLHLVHEDAFRAAEPDLIITQRTCSVCAVDGRTVEALAASMPSPPRVLSLDPHSLEDVFDDIVRVGDAAGLARAAQACVVSLRARFWDARDRVNPYVDGPRVAVIEWVDPLYLAGHWTPGMVDAAGGVPVGPTIGEPSQEVSPREFVDLAPERVVIAPCGISRGELQRHVDSVVKASWWRDVPASSGNTVLPLEGTRSFSRPGPGLIETFETLMDWLQGPAAGPPARSSAAPDSGED